MGINIFLFLANKEKKKISIDDRKIVTDEDDYYTTEYMHRSKQTRDKDRSIYRYNYMGRNKHATIGSLTQYTDPAGCTHTLR